MKKAIRGIKLSTIFKGLPIIIIWVLFFIVPQEKVFDYSTSPEHGVLSIFTGGFLHANYSHIINNTTLMILLLPLLNKYKKGYKYYLFLLLAYIIPSIVIYMGGQSTIGISGLVYALFSYLMFRLSIKENLFMFALLFCMYGSPMVEGLFPVRPYVSWIGHSSGALLGLLIFLTEKVKK